MPPLFIGQHRIELPSTPSTNSAALDLLSEQPAEGTLVWTHDQTSGRGQMGNSWFSTSGLNLTFSIIFNPEFLEATNVYYLAKMTSVALHKALKHFLPENEVQIKWPNDLLVDRQKVAGILIDTKIEKRNTYSVVEYAVIGIGLNVNQVIFPEGLNTPASSLKLASGHQFELQEILDRVLVALETEYLDLKLNKKYAQLDHNYLQTLYGYQESIQMRIDGEARECHLVGVEKSGRLALTVGDQLRYFNLKEVSFIL